METNHESNNVGSQPVIPDLVEAEQHQWQGAARQSGPGQVPPRSRPTKRRGGRFGCFGWFALMICLAVISLETLYILAQGIFVGSYDASYGIQEKYVSHSRWGSDKVAIISVNGVIMEGDGFVKKQIDRVKKDKSVRAVVLRINSPGGTVTGSDYIHHHLVKLRNEKKIPIVASMGSMAASGGYYVTMAVGDQENSIYAEPTTTTGSIGVIIPHYDVTGLMEKYGIKNDSIASHPRKQMLSMTRELEPEDRKIIEEYLDETFQRFKEIVRSGRPALAENDARLTELATGEIFTATQAQRHGLVDTIGFVEDAVDRAIELANLDKNSVRVVRFAKPSSLFDLASTSSSGFSQLDPRTLLELTIPRAYYLMTSLPGRVQSEE